MQLRYSSIFGINWLIDHLDSLNNTNNCPFPPTLRARVSSRVAFPSRWPWTLCISGQKWHWWLGAVLSHRVPCLCNLVDFCVLTLPCQSKEAREGPGRITLEGKKSPAFGEKKTAKLSTKMAQKERIKTLDDFPHLAVLSLSLGIFCLFRHQWYYCFSWRGTRMFFQPLPCS